MFVQVIQGKVSDAGKARGALDRWNNELASGATGYLGTTAGVTADGTLVIMARFESEEAARRNSERPEQDAWWKETTGLFDGEVTFHDSTKVQVDTYGNPDDAGFGRIMQGKTTDPERGWELMQDDGGVDWQTLRPDILGTLMVAHDDGGWTMAIYFTSEAEARAGEQKEMPSEVQQQMAELDALSAGPPQFLDIREPWLISAR